MGPSTKDKIKDYVVIISSASAIIMGGFSLVSIGSYIRMLSIVYDSINGLAGSSNSLGEVLGGYWCCLVLCFLFAAVGIVNIIYIQQYLRDKLPKTVIGYVANFGAIVMSGLLLTGLIIASNIYNTGPMFIPVFVSTTSGLFAYNLILLGIAVAVQIASTIIMFKWEDPAACKVINITQTTPGAIMLSEAALNTKRETPPVLNADPNAPMQPAGHNIWDPNLVAPNAGAATQFEQPPMAEPMPAPVQPVAPVQPMSITQPMQSAQSMQAAETAQQTVASAQPGYDVTGTVFAQPGLEPTMNPYVQSGTYIQPDNGFNQTPPTL